MAKPMYVGYAEFSHPFWLPSACRHATTGRHIAASPYPGGYHWRPRSPRKVWYPDDKLLIRSSVLYRYAQLLS